jgi:hypothetical protein
MKFTNSIKNNIYNSKTGNDKTLPNELFDELWNQVNNELYNNLYQEILFIDQLYNELYWHLCSEYESITFSER